MLLIVTQRDDFHADWVVHELHRRHAPFVRMNTEDYALATSLSWTVDGASALRFAGKDLDLSEVSAVWYRRPVPPVVSTELPAEAAAWARGEAREALVGVWRMLDALWVNHPDRNRMAESKMWQLRTARELGFEVPDSLVSNDQTEVQTFLDAHPDGAVCKPLMSGRVPTADGEQLFFTTRITPGVVRLDALNAEPYLFQALVPKRQDIRATVIGGDVFAAAIESQHSAETSTDWRKGNPATLVHTPIAVPDDIAARCVALCDRFGLQFGAIDLALRPDGGFSFIEINPNGQWAWVEQRTGLPLRSRLIDLLLSPQSGA